MNVRKPLRTSYHFWSLLSHNKWSRTHSPKKANRSDHTPPKEAIRFDPRSYYPEAQRQQAHGLRIRLDPSLPRAQTQLMVQIWALSSGTKLGPERARTQMDNWMYGWELGSYTATVNKGAHIEWHCEIRCCGPSKWSPTLFVLSLGWNSYYQSCHVPGHKDPRTSCWCTFELSLFQLFLFITLSSFQLWNFLRSFFFALKKIL